MASVTDLGIFGTGLAAGGFFLSLGWKADDLISKQARDDLAEYLRHFEAHKTIRTASLWPRIFREFFDRIFGEKHLSFKCFWRSSIASFICGIICLSMVILLLENSLPEGEKNALLQDKLRLASVYIFGILFFNLITDYLSLLETRYVIGRIEQSDTLIKQLGRIVFDFIATGILFVFLLLVAFLVIFMIESGVDGYRDYLKNFESFFSVDSYRSFHQIFIGFPLENQETTYYRVYLWTTYFTSLWVWLYFLAQLATRFIFPLSGTVRFLKYLLPIDNYPLRSVCTVMAIIASGATWIVLVPLEFFT